MSKKKTKEQFIEEANIVHKHKYDYSLVIYKDNKTKVSIICMEHGIFEQTPYNHIHFKQNCPHCVGGIRLSKDQFTIKSNKIHNFKFDYSMVKYKNNRSKVKIICPVHGIFEQNAANHLNGRGCKKCDVLNRTVTLDEFILKSNKIHNNKYDYSLAEYVNNETKIKIICPMHGIFEQNPLNHISQKQGCPICKESRGEKEISEILKKLNINYEREYKFEDCKNINALAFDFYLIKYNTCIEFDGKQHFEPNDFFGGVEGFKKILENDQIKNEYCKNNNIHLIRIRYDDDIYLSIDNELMRFLSF